MRVTFAAPLLLAGCSAASDDRIGNSAAAPAPGEPDRRIECRSGAAGRFERNCSLESFASGRGRQLTVRKPDGGFRRLRVTPDGREIAAADGAERVHMARLADGRIQVSIGDDQFRLPASLLVQ